MRIASEDLTIVDYVALCIIVYLLITDIFCRLT